MYSSFSPQLEIVVTGETTKYDDCAQRAPKNSLVVFYFIHIAKVIHEPPLKCLS